MFIKNTGRYALAFTITGEDGRSRKIAFDRRRYYYDTGNVATTGITEITDEDFKELKKQKAFTALLKDGSFTEVDKEELTTPDKAILIEKDKEIARLKKELAGKGKADNSKELEAKDKEIASLKEKLEALSKGKGKGKEEKADSVSAGDEKADSGEVEGF